jgi:DUF4097 and DUF4098 domain-containing protein YvlB
MSSLVRFFGRALLALTLIAVASDIASAQRRRASDDRSRSDARADTTLSFDRNGTLTISANSGNINVVGWSRDQVQVRSSSGNNDVRLEGSSSRMTITARRGGGTLDISVPIGVRVNASTHSGMVSIRGTRGPVDAHATNGSVDVDDVASHADLSTFSGELSASNVNGDARIETISGGIKMHDVRGTIDASTVSGDIDLIAVTSKSVHAKTTSGDVTFDGLVDPTGRYDLSTHSGSVHLRIQRDASAQFSMSTWSGSIDSQFPITLKPGEQRIGSLNAKRFTFEIGGGSARIMADTFSGDITISSNGHGAGSRR